MSLIQVHGPPSGRWLESQRARGLSECNTAVTEPGGADSFIEVAESIITLNNISMAMSSTTITVDKGTRDRLLAAKLEGGYRSLDALLRDLLAGYRKERLREAGELLRRKMKEKGLTLRDLIR